MTAPNPGLTDRFASEIARHRLRYGSEDAYNGERWLCTTCPWVLEANTGSRPNATVIQAHAVHVAERLKLLVEQHTTRQITALREEVERQKALINWFDGLATSAEQTIARVHALKVDLFRRGGFIITKWEAARLVRAALEGERQ